MKNKTFNILFVILITVLGCSENGDSEFIEESGTIETTNIILSAQLNGKVQTIFANEGDFVKKGDTLLVIDHDILKIKLKQAIAGKNAAKAKLELVKTGARKEDILLATEKLNQAKANYELAKTDYERMNNLFNKQAITKKQFDDIKTRLDIAKSQYQSANENLKKIKNISRPEEVAQVKANYENFEANVELIKKQISDSHIISPVDGFIVNRFVEIGESVNYGSSIYKVSDLSVVKMVVYVNEVNLGKVKLGQKAEISIDSFNDKVYEGKIIYISPEAEFTPKNIQTKDERTKLVFAVKIQVDNKENELKAGMPADAKIKLN